MTLFEVWDSQTQETVKTWLNLQGIDCLLPEFTAPDQSVTIAIKLDGFVHFFYDRWLACALNKLNCALFATLVNKCVQAG
jgi:hypothetical protein